MPNQSSGRRGLTIVLYTLSRILFFVVPLVVLLAFGLNPYFAAVCAALIGFSLSLLLLQRQRDPLVELVYNKSNQRHQESEHRDDEAFEDRIAAEMIAQEAELTAEPTTSPARESATDSAAVSEEKRGSEN